MGSDIVGSGGSDDDTSGVAADSGRQRPLTVVSFSPGASSSPAELASQFGGRVWAFHREVLLQSQEQGDRGGPVFPISGKPFTSDVAWMQRWLAGGQGHKLHVVQRAFVEFHSLTDVIPDGTPFPWLSDVPFPM